MSWIPAFDRVLPWAILAAVPVGIVLLYFLKLRRQPVQVPSTFLWHRTIEDLHVNSLLQRLRTSLLLLLQLLAVAAAALALLRPGVRDEISSAGRLVFLWDTSASMNADDLPDLESRFDAARRQIEARVDAMTDSETAMLVTFSDRAEVMQAFTSDRNRLRQALERVEPTQRPTDILGALKAADGLANPRRSSKMGDVNDVQVADALPADLLIYSDGGFQDVTEFNLGNLEPTYQAIGQGDVTNLAITEFSAQRDLQKPDRVGAFATVINAGGKAAGSTVSLYRDGQLVDAVDVDLQPDDESGLTFEVESASAVDLRLSLDQRDDLAVDNHAFASLTPRGQVSVLLVTPGNQPMELALATPKAAAICDVSVVDVDYLKSPEYQQRAAAGGDDLIIYDRCRPPEMPATNTWTIGRLPGEDWSWGSPPVSLNLIDFDRTHPLLRYLELYSLLIFSGRAIEGPAGTTTLVEADAGPVMAVADRSGYRDLVMAFELVSQNEDGGTQANTNWYAERSWPVFVFNVLRHLAGAAQSTGAPSYPPGQTVTARLESRLNKVQLRRIGVDGRSVGLGTLPVGASGTVEITQTDRPGSYQLVDPDSDRVIDRFAINLFDRTESAIATAPAIELGYEKVDRATATIDTRREYWRWLLFAALLILAAEWWLYARRVA